MENLEENNKKKTTSLRKIKEELFCFSKLFFIYGKCHSLLASDPSVPYPFLSFNALLFGVYLLLCSVWFLVKSFVAQGMKKLLPNDVTPQETFPSEGRMKYETLNLLLKEINFLNVYL